MCLVVDIVVFSQGVFCGFVDMFVDLVLFCGYNGSDGVILWACGVYLWIIWVFSVDFLCITLKNDVLEVRGMAVPDWA